MQLICWLLFILYIQGEDDWFVTLRESRHIVSHGTTGLCSWQACITVNVLLCINQILQAGMELVEWIAEHRGKFNDKYIMHQ